MTKTWPEKLRARSTLRLTLLGAAVASALGFGLFQIPRTRAQSTPATNQPLPSFEVASIRPDRSGDTRSMMEFRATGLSASGATTKKLIAFAYNIEEFQVSSGPSWISSDKYYVKAKVEDSVVEQLQKLPDLRQDDQIRLMVQSLLVDRFNLKVSHGTKELPIYALVIAKNGPKLQESKPGDTSPNAVKGPEGHGRAAMARRGGSRLTDRGASMAAVAEQLSRLLGRRVVDRTGLKAKYTFTLEYSDDEARATTYKASEGTNPGVDNGPPPDSSGPSIFTALQEQLGLKLEPTKGPVEVLVIDHIEKPSEN